MTRAKKVPRLSKIIATLVLVSFSTGCFVPVQHYDRDVRFGRASFALGESDEKWQFGPSFDELLPIGVFVLMLLIVIGLVSKGSNAEKVEDLGGYKNLDDLIQGVCQHWSRCGKWTTEGCTLYHSSVIQSRECLKAQLEASCEDYGNKQAAYHDICWPHCDIGPETCRKGNRIICDDGHQVVVSCREWCGQKGLSYAGGCTNLSLTKVQCNCR